MRHLLLKLKGTLPSVLASLMLLVWAGSSFAQVPSASAPPFQPSTFSAAATFAAPQTGAGDLFCIVGSATRLIKVKQFNVSGTNSTAQTSLFNLVKRSTANTGGTATAPAAGALDSTQTFTSATATLAAYTAVPTPGTLAGTMGSRLLGQVAATVGAILDRLLWRWEPGALYSDVRLRGVAQSLCLNAPNAFTTAGPSLTVEVIWTEQ
jgi:hypothetical protein